MKYDYIVIMELGTDEETISCCSRWSANIVASEVSQHEDVYTTKIFSKKENMIVDIYNGGVHVYAYNWDKKAIRAGLFN